MAVRIQGYSTLDLMCCSPEAIEYSFHLVRGTTGLALVWELVVMCPPELGPGTQLAWVGHT